MENKVMYKAVYCGEQNKRVSIFAGEEYKLEYKKGKIVEKIPGTLGIFVFNTEENAKEFIYGYLCKEHRIIKVRPINYRKIYRMIPYGCRAGSKKIRRFYEMKMDLKRIFKKRIFSAYHCCPAPKGSYVCDAVEVLE